MIHGNGAGGGSGINMDGVTDSLVQNNLLYDNHASGISLYRIDGATGSHDNVVVNNTIVNAADARWCVNINTGSTGNRRAQQHAAAISTRRTARSPSTRPAARASRRTTTP